MSTLKADTIQNTSGGAATLTKQEGVKSRFVYAQHVPVVYGSFNISSVTDVTTGGFTGNRTNAMSDTTYATQFTPTAGYNMANSGSGYSFGQRGHVGTVPSSPYAGTYSASATSYVSNHSNGSFYDYEWSATTYGDLA
tara:strand:- start:212 stop:625 length:414 start_codon:yes stop_codon:yes gene_type:complete